MTRQLSVLPFGRRPSDDEQPASKQLLLWLE